MHRTDWTRITRRRYISRECTINGNRTRESLIFLDDVAAPLTVDSAGKQVKIVEKGYSWLQIAEEGQKWWLTSMFDEHGTLLQLYFDITAGNLFDDTDNPRFRDMYLDIIMNTDEEICILDGEELSDALSRGEITPQEYAQTRQACDELYRLLTAHSAEVLAYCRCAHSRLTTQASLEEGAFGKRRFSTCSDE